MDFLCFLALGPKRWTPDEFLRDTLELNQFSSKEQIHQEIEERFAQVWDRFKKNSQKVILASAGLGLTSITLLAYTSASVFSVATAVISAVMTCFATKRMIEALYHALRCRVFLPQTALCAKIKQVEKCLACIASFRSLEITVPEEKFVENFFSENFFSKDENSNCTGINSYFDYYIQLEIQFKKYREKIAFDRGEFEKKLFNLESTLNYRADVLRGNAEKAYKMICSEESEDSEGENRIDLQSGEAIKNYVIKIINAQPKQIIESLNSPKIFIKEITDRIICLKEAILENDLKRLENKPAPLYREPSWGGSIKWPEILYDPQECLDFTENELKEFIDKMNSL